MGNCSSGCQVGREWWGSPIRLLWQDVSATHKDRPFFMVGLSWAHVDGQPLLSLLSNCDNQNVWKHHQCPLEGVKPTSSVNPSRAQRDQCGGLTSQDLESPTSDSSCTL